MNIPRRKPTHRLNKKVNNQASVVDSIGPIAPNELRWEKAFRLYLAGHTIREVADQLGCSVGSAWDHVSRMTEALRDVSSPEHRGAVRELLLRRYAKIFRLVEHCLDDAVEGDRGTIPGLCAVAIKVCQEVAHLHGLDSDSNSSGVPSAVRLEETARRLALIGPHSRAKEMAPTVRAALAMAGIKAPEPALPSTVETEVQIAQTPYIPQEEEITPPAPGSAALSGRWVDFPP